MSHNTLYNYYHGNFHLSHRYEWSLESIERMMPFELDVYRTLLLQHLEEEQEQAVRSRNGRQ